MSTAYSTTTYKKDINTLEELDQSGLSITTKNVDIFGGPTGSKVGASLTKRIHDNSSAISIFIAANKRMTSVVERKVDAALVIESNFTDKDGIPKLHVVNECPRSYHLAYIVYKDYPFLKQINGFFQRTVEAGLNDKWYFDTEFSILLSSRQSKGEIEKTKKLTLVDVQTSFWFLVISLTMSTIAFCGEIVIFYGGKAHGRCCKRKSTKIKTVRTDVKNKKKNQQYPFLF